MHTIAKREGDHWILNGTKAWVTNGIEGGAIIVMARSDIFKGHNGVSAFIVPTNTPGIFLNYIMNILFIISNKHTIL